MPDPTISVKLTATDAGFERGFATSEKTVNLFAKNVTLAGDAMGKKFNPQAEQGGKQVRSLSAIVNGFAMGAGMAFFRTVSKSVGAMVNFVKGGVQYAAQVEQMEGVLSLVGVQQGITSEEMNKSTEAIRDVGIETGVAQQMLAQFTRMQLSTADAVKVAQSARDVAVISGANTTETAWRIVHGVMTRQTDVLRTAGINIGSMDMAYKAHAATLDKTVSQMTAVEQQQAILSAVFKEAGKVQGAATEADKSAIKQLGSLSRIIKEIALEAGRPFVDAFSAGVYAVKEFADVILEAIREGGKLRPVLDTISKIVGALSDDVIKLVDDWVTGFPAMVDEIEVTADGVIQFGAKVAGVVQTIIDAITAATFPFKALGKIAGALFEPFIKRAEATVLHLKAIGEALRGNMKAAADFGRQAQEKIEEARQATEDYYNTIIEVAEELPEATRAAQMAITGLSFTMGQTAFLERFTEDVNEAGEAMKDFANIIAAAAGKIEMTEQALVNSLKAAIAEQLQAQWAAADEERKIAAQRAQIRGQYQKSMQQAQVNHQRGQAQLIQNHNQQQLDIERKYQEALDAIRRRYEMARGEAIDARDALALVQAQRTRDEELAQAGNDRDAQEDEAQQAYREQQNALGEALAEQQNAAREARDQAMAELQARITAEEEEKRRQAEREKTLQDVSQAESLSSLQQYMNDRLWEQVDAQNSEYLAAVQHLQRMRRLHQAYNTGQYGSSGGTSDGGVQRMQYGGSGVVTQPTMFMAGDTGPEAYSFVPLGAGAGRRAAAAGGSRINQEFTFNGALSSEQKEEYREIARMAAVEAYQEIVRE